MPLLAPPLPALLPPLQWKEREQSEVAEGLGEGSPGSPSARKRGARRGPKPLPRVPGASAGRALQQLRAHSLLRRWAAAVGLAGLGGLGHGGGAPTPGPAVTAAMEMVKSLLLLAERQGALGEGVLGCGARACLPAP